MTMQGDSLLASLNRRDTSMSLLSFIYLLLNGLNLSRRQNADRGAVEITHGTKDTDLFASTPLPRELVLVRCRSSEKDRWL